ncbi:MAG: SMC family ATPase, partial [Anaerolineae bacterium]
MCYREAVLDFTGIHVACLAGDNGAGKSALLDAVTWALWGHSRLGARGDDDLIRLGQDSMRVEFTFRLQDDLYRVLRRREADARSRTMLDFQVRDEGRWRTLVEGGVRATQGRIEDMLRLDHDTFVNSSFLRQGRADEFTVKTAAERKRVLGDILGLDRWATYEDRVKQRLREIETEIEAISLRLEEIDAELDRRPEYQAQLEAAQAAVAELSEALEEARSAYQQVEEARTELRHLEAQLADQEERIARAQRELEGLAEERHDREERLAGFEQLVEDREQIEAGYRAYRQAVDRERELGDMLRQSVQLDERRRALTSKISEACHKLKARREILDQRIEELEGRRPDEELLEEREEVRAKLEHLERLSDSREAARDDLARIAERQAELRARNEGLKHEMEALKERINLLNQADAECPLCEQPLTKDHRLELLDQIEEEGNTKADAYRTNRAAIEELSEQTSALERQIEGSDRELRELAALQRQAAALDERIEQGQQAEKELKEARAALADVEGRLRDEAFAIETRAELESVLAEAEDLGYDKEAHEEARQAVSDGQVFAERKAQLETVEERVEEEHAGLERLAEAEGRWREELEAARQRRDRLAQQSDRLREELEDADEVEEELHRMRAKEAEARQQLGAAQQRLAACEALEEQKANKVGRRQELAKEEAIYNDLRTAFGIRGVPAMIIEAAVPEIEAEANQLLSRMTRGRMNVRFDTQRETKAGEVREALEIAISDEVGTRPYENYSGGEQFRVNFAIRVALSKLLARRAGAQLQTLVIDEGFGTQDAQGRQRLVEAINAVRDDFARVLVIT